MRRTHPTIRVLWLAALLPAIALGAIRPVGASGPCCAGEVALAPAAAAAEAPCCCGEVERCCSADPLTPREPGPEPAAPEGSERGVLRALAKVPTCAAPLSLLPPPREAGASRPTASLGAVAALPRCPLHIRLSVLQL